MKSCRLRAELFPKNAFIERAEMTNRYSKALKVAGAFAFLDEAQEMTMAHYYQAIKLAEDSGKSLLKMLARPPNYARLARFIADKGTALTIPEIQEKLPFFRVGDQVRKDMLRQAIAFGMRNNIVIRRGLMDEGVETFTGEKLKPTNVDEIQISVSHHEAYDYVTGQVPFKEFAMLSELKEDHFVTHVFKNGHRHNQNLIPGFNLLVLDVDGGIPISAAHKLLAGHAFATYTTRRHAEDAHRYRVLLPTSHFLKLSVDDYKAFMDSVFKWLPFPMPTDPGANQAAKKWLINHDAVWHVETQGQPKRTARVALDDVERDFGDPQLEGPEPGQACSIETRPHPSRQEPVGNELLANSADGFLPAQSLVLDQVIVEDRFGHEVAELNHVRQALEESRVLGPDRVAPDGAKLSRDLSGIFPCLFSPGAGQEFRVHLGVATGDRGKLASLDHRPDRHALVGILETLEFGLETVDHTGAGLVRRDVSLDLDAPGFVALILVHFDELRGKAHAMNRRMAVPSGFGWWTRCPARCLSKRSPGGRSPATASLPRSAPSAHPAMTGSGGSGHHSGETPT